MIKRIFARLLLMVSGLAVAVPVPLWANAPQVIVAQVEQDEIVESIEALGTLKPNESVDLLPSVTERVVALHFNDGDKVEQGQVLVELQRREEEASLRELRIATEDAQRQYERFLPLFQRGDVSQSVLDERKRDWDLARAKEAVLQARLEKLTIEAPFSGRVGQREVSLGALVTPSTRITRLKDISEVKLDFGVPTRFLALLYEGQSLEATTDAYPQQAFTGHIETLLTQVDVTTRSVQVRAMLNNDNELLKPGMLMKVSLQQAPRRALFVPETAIVPVADRHFVFVLGEEEEGLFKLQRQAVTLGQRQPGRVEVLQGLTLGQSVVSQGALRVRPGMQVRALTQLERLSDQYQPGDAQ